MINTSRCLHKSGGTLKLNPGTCCDVIMACAVLHNMATAAGLPLPDLGIAEADNDDADEILENAVAVNAVHIRNAIAENFVQ